MHRKLPRRRSKLAGVLPTKPGSPGKPEDTARSHKSEKETCRSDRVVPTPGELRRAREPKRPRSPDAVNRLPRMPSHRRQTSPGGGHALRESPTNLTAVSVKSQTPKPASKALELLDKAGQVRIIFLARDPIGRASRKALLSSEHLSEKPLTVDGRILDYRSKGERGPYEEGHPAPTTASLSDMQHVPSHPSCQIKRSRLGVRAEVSFLQRHNCNTCLGSVTHETSGMLMPRAYVFAPKRESLRPWMLCFAHSLCAVTAPGDHLGPSRKQEISHVTCIPQRPQTVSTTVEQLASSEARQASSHP